MNSLPSVLNENFDHPLAPTPPEDPPHPTVNSSEPPKTPKAQPELSKSPQKTKAPNPPDRNSHEAPEPAPLGAAPHPAPMSPNLNPGDFPQFGGAQGVDDDAAGEDPAGELPDFDQHRHPYVKALVRIVAWFTMGLMIYFAYKTLPERHENIFCYLTSETTPNCTRFDDKQVSIKEITEFVIRGTLEFTVPLATIVVYFIMWIAYKVAPKKMHKFKNPVHSFILTIALAYILQLIDSLSTSLSLLSALGSTNDIGIWDGYLKNSFLSIVWMYALINLEVFHRLTRFDHIRLVERVQRRQRAVEDAQAA
ncbi:unnamed protein product [Caenorhabditis auriculariae]|uniref:Uncharacterized protein n=1 Tax=Caenorhabditis auriculariae TaxID=2777116 RepID=A0A8S1GPW9_9PELO|nr:unnamed protein product [Caenorhabditis auriculariae]